jgi:hypothetical protein
MITNELFVKTSISLIAGVNGFMVLGVGEKLPFSKAL